ncbi:RNA-directed DNA polymerase, eukaryota, reverse transcriptase zinc-binding domain protein [Tanacetum coccineum]
MVKWIMVCITSSAFLICLNGETLGFFKGGRGLRQGDPISPYPFTMIMEVFNLIVDTKVRTLHKEINTVNLIVGVDPTIRLRRESKYHFGCKDLKLSHLCFADDLLVLCKGNKGYLEVIKKSLHEFSQVSGLNPNLGKILPSMQIYWAFVYLLPDTVLNELDKKFKRFLWNSGDSAQGKAKVAWKVECMPKDQGGLVRDSFKRHVWYNIGNGKKTSLFYDKWCSCGPLSGFINKRTIYDARRNDDLMIADMVVDNRWRWPDGLLNEFPVVKTINVPISQNDKRGYGYVVKQKYPESSIYNKLSLDHYEGRLAKCAMESCCMLKDIVADLSIKRIKSSIGMVVNKIVLAATVYYLWQERNQMIFRNESRSEEVMCNIITDEVRTKLMSIMLVFRS